MPTEPEPPCLVELRQLYAQISSRMQGKGVQSVGHKGRSMSYADVSLKDQIAFYRQLWAQCPAAQTALPNLQNLDAAVGTRGRPGVMAGRSWV